MFINGNIDNFNQLKQLDKYLEGHNGFVAGGVFKNIFCDEKINDVDIFFRNREEFLEAKAMYEAIDLRSLYSNDRAVSYNFDGVRVDLVNHVYGTPEQILNQFDFTITKFAYGFHVATKTGIQDSIFEILEVADDEFILYSDKFFEHLMMKRLVIDNQLNWPVSTFERSYKYSRYGYNLCRESKVILLNAIIERGGVESSELAASLYAGLD